MTKDNNNDSLLKQQLRLIVDFLINEATVANVLGETEKGKKLDHLSFQVFEFLEDSPDTAIDKIEALCLANADVITEYKMHTIGDLLMRASTVLINQVFGKLDEEIDNYIKETKDIITTFKPTYRQAHSSSFKETDKIFKKLLGDNYEMTHKPEDPIK